MKLGFSRSIFLWLVFLAIFSSLKVKAQEWEYGAALGTSGYMGDYNQDKIYKFNSLSGSLGVKYNFNPTWGLRGNLSLLRIKGDGKDLKDSTLIGSTFKNTLKEFTVLSEFNFFKFEPNTKKVTYTPYVFAGLGAVMFELESVNEQGKLIKRHPIRPVVLYGAGFKYNLKSSWSINGELVYRTALTGALDGYASPVPNNNFFDKLNTKDSYMTFQIGLTYTIFEQGCPTW